MSAVTLAQDWPQFLGPTRTGVYAGAPLNESWGPEGPKIAWRKTIGAGFAGPVVVQGRLLVFHRLANQEILDALDARTGMAQWRYAYPTAYRDDFGFDEGPRAVPVVADGVVYTFGAEGQLHAVDLAKGTRLWSVDTMQRFEVPKGFFGSAGSPLVEDGRVLANVGGPKAGIVAFDAKSGKVLWTAAAAGASYSSPLGVTINGRRYAVFLTRVLEEFEATGQILGKNTEELESYEFEGKVYGPGERPVLRQEWFDDVPFEKDTGRARGAGVT
jgi:outer membrane protein assembly factor BamB